MKRLLILLVITILLFTYIPPVYGDNLMSEYLYELGLKFYQRGRYSLALHELQKALIVTPGYQPALKYIKIIEGQLAMPPTVSVPPVSKTAIEQPPILEPGIKPPAKAPPPPEKETIPTRKPPEEIPPHQPEERISSSQPEKKTSLLQLKEEIPPAEEEVHPPQLKEKTPLPQPEELKGFIELAIKNNQPTQIAREEIKLAQLKIKEAQRNLFPAFKLGSYLTDGEVGGLYKYEERELKAQLDQPVYYGGRLRNTFKQSEVNLEITKRNYDRLKIDVAHKTEVAYYNLVANRVNLGIQRAIREEAKKVLYIVQEQSVADLVTPLELTSTQSWYEQINFQIDSVKQDLAMSKLSFMQVLNISESPEITLQELEIKELNLYLNTCLEMGLKHRPEIYLSEQLVKYNQYGKKVEEGKNKFTIDLTTSYGFYQGAYETEPMTAAHNWYIGLKATKPWGGSTTTTSATTEEAEPRYGQTAPTSSTTIGAEFNFLDNLQRLSEDKEAEIELQRSLSDLNETTKTINFEIKDAYFNYQKAILQANAAQSETEFRRHQIKVLKIRAQVNELGFSQVMEALINLSLAQNKYLQALANYFLSLANLKKAAGYGI